MCSIIKLKLYGEAYNVHKLAINPSSYPNFKATAKMFDEPLHEAILNIDFFHKLNVDNYKSLKDIMQYSFSGLINNSKSNIEMYLGRNRKAKFQLESLFRPQTLFPLYRTNKVHICTENLSQGIYVEEIEIGLIGVYQLEVDNFQIEKLMFNLTDIQMSNVNYELLSKVSYDGLKINPIKSDLLLRSQYSFIPHF